MNCPICAASIIVHPDRIVCTSGHTVAWREFKIHKPSSSEKRGGNDKKLLEEAKKKIPKKQEKVKKIKVPRIILEFCKCGCGVKLDQNNKGTAQYAPGCRARVKAERAHEKHIMEHRGGIEPPPPLTHCAECGEPITQNRSKNKKRCDTCKS